MIVGGLPTKVFMKTGAKIKMTKVEPGAGLIMCNRKVYGPIKNKCPNRQHGH